MRNVIIVIKKCIILFTVLLLVNCSYSDFDDSEFADIDDEQESISELNKLKTANQDKAIDAHGDEKNSSIRQVALHEMALSIGMRSGLYSRSKEVNEYLLDNADALDKVFDFRGLILENRIMPPVLIEARKTMDAKSHEALPTDEDTFLLNDNPSGKALAKSKIRVERSQNNFRTLRITDRIYKIIRQARFAITVPSWRDYLHADFTKPSMPEAAILPKNDEEQKVWSSGIEEGWNLGYQQADQILKQNLMLLKRDYLGMIRYRTLLTMNMVSAPYVSKRNYGVTGDGDEIKIHDRVLTITALPALKPDSKLWTPFLTQDQDQELESKLSTLNLDKLLKYLPNGKGMMNKENIYKK